MLTVACVYKSGGLYDAGWVRRLERAVRNHLSVPYRFVCLTDRPEETTAALVYGSAVPLQEDWKGWWSKIELFRPGLFPGRVFYLDLDSIVVGNLDSIANYPHRFTMAHEYYRPGHFCSTAMAWDGTEDFGLFGEFKLNAKAHMHRCDVELQRRDRANRLIGDQAFIEIHMDGIGLTIDTFKGLFHDNVIASYKVHHCQDRPPREASVVAFHGKPKPHEIDRGWVKAYWDGPHA